MNQNNQNNQVDPNVTSLTIQQRQQLTEWEDRRIQQWGHVASVSKLFRGIQSPEQGMIAILAGREIGLSTVQSLMGGVWFIPSKQGITVRYSSHAIAGFIKSKYPEYDYRVLEHTNAICTIDFLRPTRKESNRYSYTIGDALRMGKGKSDNYLKHPKNMLFARCISDGSKWFFSDLFRGNVYAEGDFIDVDYEVVNQNQPPDTDINPPDVGGAVNEWNTCTDFYNEIVRVAKERGIENIREYYKTEHEDIERNWTAQNWEATMKSLDILNMYVHRYRPPEQYLKDSAAVVNPKTHENANLDTFHRDPENGKMVTKEIAETNGDIPPGSVVFVDDEGKATTEPKPKNKKRGRPKKDDTTTTDTKNKDASSEKEGEVPDETNIQKVEEDQPEVGKASGKK